MKKSTSSLENSISASDPNIARRLGQFVSGCSWLAVAFGLWVLAGWILHIQIVKSILPGQVAVKANTAVCSILIGFALWVLRKEQPSGAAGWRLAAKTAATIASVVGLLSLPECLWGWDLGIDQLLFAAGAEDIPGSVRPGLMSPITAFSFLALGAALLLLDVKTRVGCWWAQLLSSGVAIVSLFGVLDFVLDPASTHTHISPITAFTLFLLAFGLLFSRIRSGFGALVASRTLGGTLARRLMTAAVFVPLLAGWLRWKAESAGLYSDWAGVAVMTVLSTVLLASLTAWTASVIDRTQRERQQTEEARNASEERFRLLLDGVRDYAIYMLDPNGNVNSWNAGAENVKGYRAEEILGQHFSCFYTARDRENGKPKQELEQALSLGRVEGVGERVRKDGSAFWANYIIAPLRDDSGRLLAFSKIVRDVTERKRAEAALQESETNFRALSELTPQMVWACAPDGLNVYFNQRWVGYTGLTLEQSYGRGWDTPFHADDKPAAWKAWNHAVATGDTYRIDCRLRAADGSYRWFLLRGVPLRDASGSIVKWFGTCTDIDDLKRAEEKLRAVSLYARSLIEASLDPLVTISREGKITDVNEATEKVTGVSRGELVGSDFSNYFTEPESARRGYEQVFAQGTVQDYPLAIRHASGRVIDVLYNAAVFRDEAGEIEGVFAAARDVTERKRAEDKIRNLNQELEQRVQERTAELHESEQRVRRKLESILSPEGNLEHLELADLLDIPAVQSLAEKFYELARIPMFILDLQGNPVVAAGWQEICMKFHRTNPEACGNCRESDRELATGVAPGEFKLYKCKNNLWDVVTPLMLGAQQVGNLFSGQFFFTDETVDREMFRSQARKYGFDEQQYMTAVDRVPRLSRAEVETGMTFYTRLAQLLSQLSYSGIKLARSASQIGRVNAELAASVKELEAFTYSVSHDLRAPLRHISGFSKMLTEEFGSNLPPEAQHHLQRIQEGTRRMGLLVDDLLNLARVGRRDLTLRVSGLKSVVDEVIAELTPESGERQIKWKIGELPFVECDPGLMKQVFQNLLSNAVKFTRPRQEAIIEVGVRDEPGTPAVFVRDNGVGFSMKYADKLFGVFQRLHRVEDFEGTGVGLATVQRIIQKHGGRIWAEAELDKGATFYFTLGASGKTELKTKAAMAGDKA